MKLVFRAFIAVIAAAVSAPSSAATIIYTLSGAATAQFSIDEHPVPIQVYSTAFRMNGVSGTFNGEAVTFDKLFFYTSEDLGGVGATFNDGRTLAFSTAGEQLFTGTVQSPTMRTGTFALWRYGSSPDTAERYTLTAAFSTSTAGGIFVPPPAGGAGTGPGGGPDQGTGGFIPGTGGGLIPPPTTGVGAIPEPATWAMMLAGFGAVGCAMRRQRKMQRLAPGI